MDELWKVMAENGLAENAKELEMRMPEFGDWSSSAKALVEAGIVASIRRPLVKGMQSEAELALGRAMLQPKKSQRAAVVAPVIAKKPFLHKRGHSGQLKRKKAHAKQNKGRRLR